MSSLPFVGGPRRRCLHLALRTLPSRAARAKPIPGADGETRTPTGYPTAPSRQRVYQFHHVGRTGIMNPQHKRLRYGVTESLMPDRCYFGMSPAFDGVPWGAAGVAGAGVGAGPGVAGAGPSIALVTGASCITPCCMLPDLT